MNIVRRREDWPERLAEYLASVEKASFLWGIHDCCLFACDAVLAMTDTDLAGEFRGRYDNAKQAKAVMKAFAGKGLREMADKIAEQHNIIEWATPLMARRGDVVLAAPADRDTLGILALSGTLILAPGMHGLIRLPREAGLKAWRVG